MRHNNSGRRSRNRGGSGRNGGQNTNRNQVFDSNGPDVRIRGTAHQICEKYMALAKDAASTGDIVLAESYMQHAEHYQRIINSWAKEQPQKTAPEPNCSDDDLSLPASVLGKEVKAQAEQSEKQLESA